MMGVVTRKQTYFSNLPGSNQLQKASTNKVLQKLGFVFSSADNLTMGEV